MAWSGGDTIDKALSRMGFASSGSSGASALGLGYDPTAGALGFGDFMGQKYGVDPTALSSPFTLGGDPTQMQAPSLGLGYDPTNPTKGPVGFSGDPTQPGAGFADLDAFWNKKNAEWAAQMSGPTGSGSVVPPGSAVPIGGGAVVGGIASLGGEWAGVDQWNQQILAAANQYGVPANLIKAIMKLESGGDPGSFSPQSATGLMQIMPDWNGTAGLSIYDNQQNIMLGAYILKQSYDNWVSQGAADPWQEAVRDYIGRGGPDAFGTDQNSYWAQISKNLAQLNAGGSGAGVTTGPGWQSSFASMFGTTDPSNYFEFDAPGGPDLYGYGTEYGLNGSNHTGIDIPLALNTPMRAGFSGHVVCGGTGIGTGEDSCSAFNDYFGGGAGRIEIMSNDGNTVLIYGHSSQSAVRPGQLVNAGDLVGYSGGMNGPHVHLEARVKDPSMPSGWRLVDPRTVLGGSVPSGGSSAPVVGSRNSTGGTSYNNAMMNALLVPGWHWS